MREFRSRWKLMSIALVGCVVVFLTVAFLLPPRYRAEILLAPMQADPGGLAQMLGPLGGIAEIAGLGNLSGNDDVSSLAVLRSRDLGLEFIRRYDLVEVFLAEESWLGGMRTRNRSPSVEKKEWDAYKVLADQVRHVSEDRRTGLITLAFQWRQREPLPRWLTQYVELCNARLQVRAIEDAARQLTYLKQQLDTASSVEVRQALNRLIEARLKEMAVAQTRTEYAFRTIDPPVIPQERVGPRRGAFALAGVLLGFMICAAIALLGASRSLVVRPQL